MSHDPVIAKLQEVIRELHQMDVTAASAAQLSPHPANATANSGPLPAFPPANPVSWMSRYQQDCLIWANALQHGIVTQHPDANEYRNNPSYVWPDMAKALGNTGTLTRPGGTPGNQPRAI